MHKIFLILLITKLMGCNSGGSQGNVEIPNPSCGDGEVFDTVAGQCQQDPSTCQGDEQWDEASQSCSKAGIICDEGLEYDDERQMCIDARGPDEICADASNVWDATRQLCLSPDQICSQGTCNELKAACIAQDGFWLEEAQACYDSEEQVCTVKGGTWDTQGCSLKIACSAPLKWSPYHYQCIDEDWSAYGIEDRFDVAQYHLQTARFNYLFYWLDAVNDLDLATAYPAVEVIKVEKSSGQQIWARTYAQGSIFHEIVSLKEDQDGNLVFLGNKKASYGSSSSNDDIVYGKIEGETGDLLWSNFSFGTDSAEEARSVLITADNDYIIMGNTQGNLCSLSSGRQDIFIRALNSDDGSVLWETQGFTSAWESLESAVIKDDNIIISHFTYNDFTRLGDTSISIFSLTSRSFEQSKSFGQAARVRFKDLAVDGDHIYLTGYTTIDFINDGYQNNTDTIYAKLIYPSLDYVWKQQLGSTGWDYMYQIAVARGDYVYFSGTTQGDLWTDGSQKTVDNSTDGIVDKLDKASGAVSWIRRLISNNPTIGNISSGPKGELYYSAAQKGGLLSTGLRDYDATIKRITPEG